MSQQDHSGLTTQLVPDSFRAYRVWSINDTKAPPELLSFNNTIWPRNKVLEADHNNRIHQAPYPDCTCGIYARYHPLDLDDLIFPIIGDLVVGAIDMTGIVDHGTRGAKSQFAKPTALAYPMYTTPRSRILIVEIAEKYQLPLFDSMEKLAQEFPMEDLSFLSEHISNKMKSQMNWASIENRLAQVTLNPYSQTDLAATLGFHRLYFGRTDTITYTTGNGTKWQWNIGS